MNTVQELIAGILRDPNRLVPTLAQWDVLIRQARQAGLLARLYVLLDDQGLLSDIPERPRNHLYSAYVLAARHAKAIRWEVSCIQRSLSHLDIPLVLLKGAAYIMAGLPTARGRLFTDVDLMVPKSALTQVEESLLFQGWVLTHLDAYDQRYYRQWMHELPPLQHIQRKTMLDVHHTILPETARLHPDPQKLLQAAVPLEGQPGLYVLAPADMVLHSATHLFHDGELENGLRDLVDLDDLLRHFGKVQGFWDGLVARAEELNLIRPLYYALRYTKQILDTPIPEAVMEAAQTGRPGGVMPGFMNFLFRRALQPDHVSCKDHFTGLARWLLYVRSHYLRMPLYLLIPHLARKTLRRQPEKA